MVEFDDKSTPKTRARITSNRRQHQTGSNATWPMYDSKEATTRLKSKQTMVKPRLRPPTTRARDSAMRSTPSHRASADTDSPMTTPKYVAEAAIPPPPSAGQTAATRRLTTKKLTPAKRGRMTVLTSLLRGLDAN